MRIRESPVYLAETEHDSENQWKFEPIKKRRKKGGEDVLQGQLFWSYQWNKWYVGTELIRSSTAIVKVRVWEVDPGRYRAEVIGKEEVFTHGINQYEALGKLVSIWSAELRIEVVRDARDRKTGDEDDL